MRKCFSQSKITNFVFLIFLSVFLVIGVAHSQTKHITKLPQPKACGVSSLESLGFIATCTFNTECDMPATRDSYLWDQSYETKIIKTKVRITRNSDGSNAAASERDVQMQMHYLNKNFASYGIQFTYEIDYINDSNFRTANSSSAVVQKMLNYVSDPNNYCNIFVGNATASLAFYPWLSVGHVGIFMNAGVQFYPGNNRSSLTHEMGHALGLYHTFAGYTEVSCESDCAENTGTTDNDLRGDWCSDTPPQISSFAYKFVPTVDECNSPNTFPEIPHINYMSYVDSKTEFTPQQVARMHCLLETHPKRVNWIDTSDPEIPYVYEDNYGNSFVEEFSVTDLEWIDISSIGQEVSGLGDDNFVGPLNLAGEINLYNESFTQIYIGSNGYLSFSPFVLSSANGPFPSIPTADDKDGFIAPFLADLNFSGSNNPGKVYMFSSEDSLVLSFVNVPLYSSNSASFEGSNTFQLIYSAIDSTITFQYLEMDDYYSSIYHQTSRPSIIGIENLEGSDGLEVNNYQIPADSSRIKIQLKTDVVSVGDNEEIVKNFTISNYPNPFNPATTISFVNHTKGVVQIIIYNELGQEVRKLVNNEYSEGQHDITWDGKNEYGLSVSSGTYYARFINDSKAKTIKMVLMK